MRQKKRGQLCARRGDLGGENLTSLGGLYTGGTRPPKGWKKGKHRCGPCFLRGRLVKMQRAGYGGTANKKRGGNANRREHNKKGLRKSKKDKRLVKLGEKGRHWKKETVRGTVPVGVLESCVIRLFGLVGGGWLRLVTAKKGMR